MDLTQRDPVQWNAISRAIEYGVARNRLGCFAGLRLAQAEVITDAPLSRCKMRAADEGGGRAQSAASDTAISLTVFPLVGGTWLGRQFRVVASTTLYSSRGEI